LSPVRGRELASSIIIYLVCFELYFSTDECHIEKKSHDSHSHNSEMQDLDSRFFLSAVKIEHKLDGFVGPQFLGVVPDAGAGILVGGQRGYTWIFTGFSAVG
jgi:hypothetical protein